MKSGNSKSHKANPLRYENRLPAWPGIICGMVFSYLVRRIIDGVTPITLDDQVAFIVIGFLAIAAAGRGMVGYRRMIHDRNLAEAKVVRGGARPGIARAVLPANNKRE